MFKIAIGIPKTNQDNIGDQCIRNDSSMLAVNDEEKHLGKVIMLSF